MVQDVLIVFASKRGSREVAAEIAATLREAGLEIDLRQADEKVDLAQFRAVVLGGSLYMGRWHEDARAFLRQFRNELSGMPVAVFTLGPIDEVRRARKGARKQLERALTKTPQVKPVAVEIFGGVVDPSKLSFPFKHMPAVDLRDWEAIRAWASGLPAALGLVREAARVRAPIGRVRVPGTRTRPACVTPAPTRLTAAPS